MYIYLCIRFILFIHTYMWTHTHTLAYEDQTVRGLWQQTESEWPPADSSGMPFGLQFGWSKLAVYCGFQQKCPQVQRFQKNK